MQHRFILEPYNGRGSRFLCPNCQHTRRTLTRYVDIETQTYVANHVGLCDRLEHCGYHYPPRAYFADNANGTLRQAQGDKLFGLQPAVSDQVFDTLPRWYVDDTAKAYHHNNFVVFLTKCFGEDTALRLANLYKIGTSKHWPGATIFWQIDAKDRLRCGKIMLYNRTDGHRVKQPFNHITWVHSLVGSRQYSVCSEQLPVGSHANCKPVTANFQLQQCLFGEHLLQTDPFKTVAIAESEKTAVICSFIYPKYIWLAAGSLEGLSRNKCRVLKDRRVILFPDVNGYNKWKLKAREMNARLPAANFTVDDTLERTATADERTHGIDIADRWIEQLLNTK